MKKTIKSLVMRILRLVFTPFFTKSVLPKAERLKLERDLISQFQLLPTMNIKTEFASQNEWHRNLNELKDQILKKGGTSFLGFDVVQKTMFITYANYSKNELAFLKQKENWVTKWRLAIRESATGSPTPCPSWPLSSSNLIHHAYHIAKFEERFQMSPVNFNLVFEFGGGYGSMCRLFHKLGFKGLYIIYDFSHFSLIQKYFLQMQGYKCLTLDQARVGESGFICISNPNELNDLLNKVKPTSKDSLFLATWSLSESPMEVRKPIEGLISMFTFNLVAYQESFNEVDNQLYFENLFERHKYCVFKEEIVFLKSNYYYFSKRMDLNN